LKPDANDLVADAASLMKDGGSGAIRAACHRS